MAASHQEDNSAKLNKEIIETLSGVKRKHVDIQSRISSTHGRELQHEAEKEIHKNEGTQHKILKGNTLCKLWDKSYI
jgi:hypothetical protein